MIAATDIEAAYREFGIEITSQRPSKSGWLSCWALDRPHGNSPSAAINVSDGPLRGRYRDLGGSGDSLSLFDAAEKFGSFGTWEDARREYAKRANLLKKFPKSDQERPADKLSFSESWSKLIVRGLLKAYPGITEEGLLLCGGRIARYPAKSPQPQYVVAWPAYGPGGIDAEIRGYVIQAADGNKVIVYRGPDAPADLEKRITIGHSGLIGRHGLKHWETAELIWKVEGLSDLLTLQSAIPVELREKHVVITNAGGTHETFLPVECASMFAGKTAAILHDCDVPGQQGAGKWISAVAGVVDSVRNVLLPFDVTEDHGKDLRDWIVGGGTYQQLLDMLAAAKEMKVAPQVESADGTAQSQQPVETSGDHHHTPKDIATEFAGLTPEQQCLKRMGIVVLGEIEGSKTITAFSQHLSKVVEIKAIDRYKIENLIQDFGEIPVKSHVAMGSEPDPAKLSLSFIRQSIAAEGGKRRLTDGNQLGLGIWELNGRLLLVNSGEFAILNGHLERSVVPTMEGKLIDLGAGTRWYDYDEVNRLLQESESPEWCQAVLNEASELFARWDNWVIDDTPQLVAALVCISFLQTVWDFRPQVAVCGPTNSGKSCLMEECLKYIFGDLVLICSKPSEAGIRQFIGHTSRVILIDEFEHDQHREKILELFRTSSRGAETLRGTAGSQKGVKFGLKHLPWVSAIEVGLKRAPDKNRYIMLELGKVKTNKSTLVIPSPETLRSLGTRLMIVGLRHWRNVKSIAAELKQRGYGAVDRRVVESFSLPCAMLGSVLGLDLDATADLMSSMFAKRDQAAASESDEAMLLQEIYESTVQMPHGEKATVSEMLTPTFAEPGWLNSLQRSGVKKFADSIGVDRVFFVKSAMRKQLLRDSEFARQDIDQILIRVDGARRDKQRMGGHSPRGISIPESEIQKLLSDSQQNESTASNTSFV